MYYEINTCRMKNLVNVIPKKNNPVVTCTNRCLKLNDLTCARTC